jgi:hypothetical protein
VISEEEREQLLNIYRGLRLAYHHLRVDGKITSDELSLMGAELNALFKMALGPKATIVERFSEQYDGQGWDLYK